MQSPLRRRVPESWVLVVAAYALALLQRPGVLVADTKLHLYVDPARFLTNVASAWSPTGDLGHVWAGQYGGYLWPMAPWFAAGDALGLEPWLVHRLWLGTLFALAAVGVVRLVDALVDGERSALHLVAPALYVLNPYVAVYANRTSIALLAYAALPWMLLAVHRGLREPTRWRWPAAFALILASTGGGVNAAVTAWVLLGPLLFVAYERLYGGVARGALRPWLGRMLALNVVLQAWWVVPTLVHSRYGLNFLPYTEQPGTIWGTTSLTESLRLMGFWTSYIGVGYGGVLRPFASHGPALLFQLGVVVASLVVPAAAIGSFTWVGRRRYAPFFLGLALIGLLVMSAGFPEGTPLRRGLTFTYNHVAPVQILRTTYKAGPLVALSLAVLAGLGATAAWSWAGSRRRAAAWRAAGAIGLAAAAAVAAWPLTSGRAPEDQLAITPPARWEQAARRVEASGPDSRAVVFPGQLFAAYDWGETIDAILPALTDHPVATRSIVPYADLRSVDLQWAVDDLVSQERAVGGQLRPLLDLMGVGDVLQAADGDRGRSGELGAGEAARVLRAQGLRFTPIGRDRRSVPADPERIAAPADLPALGVAHVGTGGLVRVLPRGPLTVVDGGATGLTGLAAFGALDPSRPLAYAPDLSTGGLRRAAAGGAQVVIADGNRRQAFVPSRLRGDRGPVLPADQDVSQDGTMLDPFAPTTGPRDAAQQTTSVLRGDLASVSAPASPQVTQLPDRRPFAAVDGDPGTAWLADRFLDPSRAVLTLRLRRARDVPTITLTPYDDSRARVVKVRVNGRTFAVHRGPNRLVVGLHGVRVVRVAIAATRGPTTKTAGAGGLREVAIPGVRAVEELRVPQVAERALAGTDLDRTGLTYLFARFTADAPWVRGRQTGERGAGLLRDVADPERRLSRAFRPPAARSWTASAWVSADPRTSDAVLDRLAGTRGALRATSASRFEGLPRNRASGAFDGSAARAWIGQWIPGRPAWLGWATPADTTLRSFVLEPVAMRVRRPTRVRLTVDGRRGPALAVGRGGRVVLPDPVRGRDFRLDVLAAAFPAGTPARLKRRRAVAIAELRAPAIARLRVPRRGRVSLGCGTAGFGVRSKAGSARAGLRVVADRAALDAGRPLRATGCARLALPAGDVDLDGAAAPLRVDQLRLASAAPTPAPAPATVPGAVVSAGDPGDGSRRDASVTASGPSWLVLGESYSSGWRATCDGRDLGASRPMQGYANAWPIAAPGCADVDFAFRPNRALLPSYVVSLVGAAGLLLLLAGGGLRRRRGLPDPEWVRGALGPLPEPGAPARTALPRALAIGAVAGAGLGFVFALRAGVLLGPLVAVVLWRGIGARTLSLTAGGLLGLVVPALYVLFPGDDRGGYSTTFATDHLGAHWVAVAAVNLLGLALVRTLSTAKGRRDGPAPAPAAAAPPGSAP